MVKPDTFLFSDVESGAAQKWSATLTASPILTSKLTNTNVYSNLPCGYLVLDGDLTLPKQYQEGMVAAQVGQSGVPFIMYHNPAGHSPHLSWIEGMVETVKRFAKTAVA